MTDTGEVRRIDAAHARRILSASRICSQLECAVLPLGDRFLLKLVDQVQERLSARLLDKPDGDAG